MPPTAWTKRVVLRRNVRLNHPKKPPNPPRSPRSWPRATGFNIVAQSAGVNTSATSTDSAIAETMVTENCR